MLKFRVSDCGEALSTDLSLISVVNSSLLHYTTKIFLKKVLLVSTVATCIGRAFRGS
jgi:hypothetical protein